MHETMTRLKKAGINQDNARYLRTSCESLRSRRFVRQFVAKRFDGHDFVVQ